MRKEMQEHAQDLAQDLAENQGSIGMATVVSLSAARKVALDQSADGAERLFQHNSPPGNCKAKRVMQRGFIYLQSRAWQPEQAHRAAALIRVDWRVDWRADWQAARAWPAAGRIRWGAV